MDSTIIEFLKQNRICCLSIQLPDGSLHAATLHYSHNDEPLTIITSTKNTSRKVQGLLKGEVQQASLVVGFSEEEWKTLQMDGEVRAVHESVELTKAKETHFTKYPDAKRYESPESIFLSFSPKWWRYTDFKVKPAKVIVSQ